MNKKKAIIGISALALILTSIISVSVLSGNLETKPQPQQTTQPDNVNGLAIYSFEITLSYLHKTEINESATSYIQKVSMHNKGNSIIPSGLTWILTIESEGYYFTASGKTETLSSGSKQLLTETEIIIIALEGYHVSKGVGVNYTLTVNGITETLTFYL